ncbi:MAG: hypothetical protein GY910_07295 [bacterium]|nr:hypothetical protein [Deltaproteobacteria bacterium]MCP4904769.1 hypothetical protein [bacterium]
MIFKIGVLDHAIVAGAEPTLIWAAGDPAMPEGDPMILAVTSCGVLAIGTGHVHAHLEAIDADMVEIDVIDVVGKEETTSFAAAPEIEVHERVVLLMFGASLVVESEGRRARCRADDGCALVAARPGGQVITHEAVNARLTRRVDLSIAAFLQKGSAP